MRKHPFSPLIVAVSLLFFGPTSWLASLQAQSPINISTLPSSNSGFLQPGVSYEGPITDTLIFGGMGTFNYPQDWYTVTCEGGKTYVITDWDSGGGYLNVFLFVFDKNGVELAAGARPSNNVPSSVNTQLFFTAPASDIYTIKIMTGFLPATGYTLTVSAGSPTLNSITGSLPYSATQTLTMSSYCGSDAAPTPGAPPPLVSVGFYGPASAGEPPAWVGYFQNWYSVMLTPGNMYYVSMSATAPFIAIQDGVTGTQLTFSATGTASFQATGPGPYTIICSTTKPMEAPVPFVLQIDQVSAGDTVTTISTPPAGTSNTVPVTVTVTGLVTGPPTGKVTVSVDGGPPSLPQDLVLGSGLSSTAVVTVTAPASGGNHTVTATYLPTGSFSGSSGQGTLFCIPVVTLSIPASVSGATTSSSYSGPAADASFAHHYQAWHSVTLKAGNTYVISCQCSDETQLAILDSNGVQVAKKGGGSAPAWFQGAQVVYTPPVTGTYFVVNTTWMPTTTVTYTLMIPSPIPSVTNVASLPFSTSVVLDSASFYGPSDASIQGLGSSSGIPPFTNYFQKWFSVPLIGTNLYSITLTGANTATLSILDSTGKQVGFGQASIAGGTAKVDFTPLITGVYKIICTQYPQGPSPSPLTLTIPGPQWSTNGIPNVRLAPPASREIELGTEMTYQPYPKPLELGASTPVIDRAVLQLPGLSVHKLLS